MARIPVSEEEMIKAIKELLKEQEQLHNNTDDKLPRINFDQHIYVPLLFQEKGEEYVKTILESKEKSSHCFAVKQGARPC